MKNYVLLLIVSTFCLGILCHCDRTMYPLVHKRDLYVDFRDNDGNNLIESLQLGIDTIVASRPPHYLLSNKEYSLTLKVNGAEYTPDPIDYKNINYPNEGLSFTCQHYDLVFVEKKDYVYEYAFTCPKLFGDDKPRSILAKWKCIKKGIYLIDELYFEGELLCKSDRERMYQSRCYYAVVTL